MTTDTEALTYDHIVALALEHGFKLKPQVDGRMALNDYVIDFARAVYDIGHAAAKAETADVGEPVAWAHFAENGNIRLWAPERPLDLDGNAAHPLYTADQLAAAVAAERERAATVVDEKIGAVRKANPGSGGRINSAVGFVLYALGSCADAIRAGEKGQPS